MKKIAVVHGKKTRVKERHRFELERNELDELERRMVRTGTRVSKFATTTLRKESGSSSACAEQGTVVAAAGRGWLVESIEHRGDLVECLAAGTVFSENANSSLIAVGDKVGFERVIHAGTAQKSAETILAEDDDIKRGSDQEASLARIVRVEKRRTQLARKGIGKSVEEQVLVANVDLLLIMVAAAEPFYNKRLIDRYLIAAEKGGLEPIILVNKIELMPLGAVQEDLQVYNALGIPTHYMSLSTGQGVHEVIEVLQNRTSVISGPSGVGKSTLANYLLGSVIQDVNEVSEKSWKGRHTTSGARMIALPFGGYLVDTPGIREFGLFDIDSLEVPFYFHDFDAFYPRCHYTSCTHTHEPGCAVLEAVERGLVDGERYQSYINIVQSLESEL